MLSQVVLPLERRAVGKVLTWEAGSVARIVCSIRPWVAGGEREGGPRRVGGSVPKTNVIVLRSTLSAQNCTKHIKEGTNYT